MLVLLVILAGMDIRELDDFELAVLIEPQGVGYGQDGLGLLGPDVCDRVQAAQADGSDCQG